MSLLEGLRWILREGEDRVLRALGTRPSRSSEPQARSFEGDERRSKLGKFPGRYRANLASLRRQVLSKLWRH